MADSTRRPDFFLVGAPRCATTAMFAFLRSHPQIFLPLRKEVHFFGSDLTRRPGNPWFITDPARYAALFAGARADQVMGESSVLYLYSATAAQEIKRYAPRARIVIQLREPVEMLYSYHGQNLLAVQEDIEDFATAYAAAVDRRRGQRIPRWCVMPQGLYYPDVVRYTEQVTRYFEIFGRDQVHVMLYEDFCANPEREFSHVLSFLGVADDFRVPFRPINSHREVRCRRLQGETQLPCAPLRLALKVLPDSVGFLALTALAALNSRPVRRPHLPADLQTRLRAEFADEVARLGQLLGRDLSHWSAPVARA